MSKYKYIFYAEMSGGVCSASLEYDLVDDGGEDEAELDGHDKTTVEQVANEYWTNWFWNEVNGGFELIE